MFDASILAVAHEVFKSMEISPLLKERNVVYDVKGVLQMNFFDGRL